MYLSRPPISVSTDPQKSPNKATQGQKPTTVMVRDRDDLVRHPATKKFTSRWQNEQSSQGPDEDIKIGERGSLTPNQY